ITPLDLILNSTSNAKKPPYKQQLSIQQKQKEKHDEHVKKILFHIGDKVLLYQSAQAKVHSDKFREK
ncbi:409_t:CDS:2, partial [Dentiscutata erythropus]